MEGDETITDRPDLLKGQKEILLKKKDEIEETLKFLSYKISVYEKAASAGELNFPQKQ